MKKKIKKVLFISLILFFAILLKSTKTMAVSIPKVYFEGDISNMQFATDERNILLRYVSDDLSFEKYAKIKVEYGCIINSNEKDYIIELYKDDTYINEENINMGKGWGAQSKYCLESHKNIVNARLYAKVQEKYNLFMDTPNNGLTDGFPVEIYINDEFLGLYTWNIPIDEWMYNMDSNNPNHIAIGAYGYTKSTCFNELITSIDNLENEGWEIEIGSRTQDTVNKFNRVLDFVINSSDEEFKRDFELYINKDAALNYLLFLYFSGVIDNCSANLMMVTYDGNIWYPTLHDSDMTLIGLEMTRLTQGMISGNNSYYKDGDYDVISSVYLCERMIKAFPNEISERWFELRKDILAKDYIINEFSLFNNCIPEETFEADNLGYYSKYNLEKVEEFLDERIPIVDNIMSKRYNPEIIEDYELGYEISNENQIINIKARTPIEDFKRIFINNNDLEVIIKDEQNINNRYASTGMKINIRNSNGDFILDEENNPATYTLVVKGDVTGDGIADAKDHVYIKAHRMELQGGALENEYFKAGDLNNDEIINYVDSNLLLLHRSEVNGYNLNF